MGPLHLALSPAVLSQLRQRGTSDFCQFCSAGFLPPLIPDFSLLPVVFLRRAQWILSVAVGDFSDDLQLKFQEQRVLMSLRNGVDMSAVLVVTSSTFYLPSSFGGSVRNIGDNRTYFFFYWRIFIISSGPRPRGFIYPPSTTLKCFSQPSLKYFALHTK